MFDNWIVITTCLFVFSIPWILLQILPKHNTTQTTTITTTTSKAEHTHTHSEDGHCFPFCRGMWGMRVVDKRTDVPTTTTSTNTNTNTMVLGDAQAQSQTNPFAMMPLPLDPFGISPEKVCVCRSTT
jgi:hypothetical protein